MQQKKQYNQTLKPPGELYCLLPLCLCDEGTCRKTPLFSTIARKNQNLSDVRSEACVVDWFFILCGVFTPDESRGRREIYMCLADMFVIRK